MSDLRIEANHMRIAANRLRRDAADAAKKLAQAAMFDQLATEIEDHLARGGDAESRVEFTPIDPDAPALFEELSDG
jgi:hypothetical protein